MMAIGDMLPDPSASKNESMIVVIVIYMSPCLSQPQRCSVAPLCRVMFRPLSSMGAYADCTATRPGPYSRNHKKRLPQALQELQVPAGRSMCSCICTEGSLKSNAVGFTRMVWFGCSDLTNALPPECSNKRPGAFGA